MANLNIAIQIAAKDSASGAIGRITSALSGLGDTAKGGFGGLQSLAMFAGGAALAGVGALAGGMGAVGAAGLSMNKQMEDVSAQLNAFTKDADKSAEILEMIRVRAAKTPFAFNEMADAAAGLLPAAKASGQELEFLISQAEILAASNPAEGLSGAAFALREAVSGDFTSIIERFNLPRQYINRLKDEGVPAMEIVSRAMQEVGFDADLVGNLAETAGGRWSTFLDTLQNLAATITQPIFDTFSGGLAVVNQFLADNEPLLTSFAEGISNTIQMIVDKGKFLFGVFQNGGLRQLFAVFEDGSSYIGGFLEALGLGESVAYKVGNALAYLGQYTLKVGKEIEFLFGVFQNGGLRQLFAVFEDGSSYIGGFLEALGLGESVAYKVGNALAYLGHYIIGFVSWKDALMALGVVVASIVLPALWGIVTAAAPVIAVGAALVGAIALARNAWENDWGGIQGAVSNAISYLQPYFEQLKTILSEFVTNILPLIADWFVNVAVPAIQQFATNVVDQLIPGLQLLGNLALQLGQAMFPVLSSALSFLWENMGTILPVVGAVGAAILAINAPIVAIIGGVMLLATAWANNWGGIQEKTQAVLDYLSPYWEALKSILNDFVSNLLPALQEVWQTMVSVWQTELQPALAELWASFQELFAELGIGTGDVDFLQIAVGALKLGLDSIILVVRALTPVIRAWADGVSFGIGQVQVFVDSLASLKRGAEAIIAPIQRATEGIHNMISAALNMPSMNFGSFSLPGFADGGIVPGAIGRPQLVLAHGGEMILNPNQQAQLFNSSSVNVDIGQITINAKDADSGKEAAKSFIAELRARGLR